jgi:heme oxygenase (mycobilin-producing)
VLRELRGICKTRGCMFVALSRFTIMNDMAEQVREALRARPHLVDRAPGFVRMEVMSPLEAPKEIWLVTWWTDEASYRNWHRWHEYHEAHQGIPKGLKLVPKSAEIRLFEVFAT